MKINVIHGKSNAQYLHQCIFMIFINSALARLLFSRLQEFGVQKIGRHEPATSLCGLQAHVYGVEV